MGILSMFRKPTHSDIYQKIADNIILASLKYRTSIEDEPNMQLTADAGAEYAYLLLHLVDRAAFKLLGEEPRNDVFDGISKIVLANYCKAVLRPTTPDSKVQALAYNMMNDLNDRQAIYSQCTSLTGDPFPSRGTLVFALSYFVYLALQRTANKDVDDILCGRRNLTKSENDDFPEMDDIIMLAVHVGESMKALRINDLLKKLL